MMWESGGERKERQEGAGVEYQVEKEVTPRKCGVAELEYTIVMCVRLALASNIMQFKYF